MLRQQERSAADGPSEPSTVDRLLELDLEAVRARNYDQHEGHSVHVTLEGVDVDDGLVDRSYLGAGQSTRVEGSLEPGRYQLRVRVDGVERHRGEYRVDETPDGTAVVELGNGAVSVTAGT